MSVVFSFIEYELRDKYIQINILLFIYFGYIVHKLLDVFDGQLQLVYVK